MPPANRRSFLVQSLLAGSAPLVPFGLTGCGGSSAPDLVLTTSMAGQTVGRAQVLAWEAQRLQTVAQRMHAYLPAAVAGRLLALTKRPADAIDDVAGERALLADVKIRAGDAAMRALVAQDLAMSAELVAQVPSSPQWVVSEIDIVSNRGTAEGFAKWFTDKTRSEDPRAMLVACPDHYLMHPLPLNGQMVIETTGGAPMASYFEIDYDDPGSLPIVVNRDFPISFNGAARSGGGKTIGGTNHRLRTLEQGFHIHPAIFFPDLLPAAIVSGHCWHLACEFSNWIEAYIAEGVD